MTRQMYSFFCDDIRQEVDGKISYIGVYTSKIYLPSFPAVISKLCLAIMISTPSAEPIKQLSIRILKDDDVLYEHQLPPETITQGLNALNEFPAHAKYDKIQMLNTTLVFSPFPVLAPCILRIRGITESGELSGQGVIIEQTPPQER